MKAYWEATADLDRVEDLQRIAAGARYTDLANLHMYEDASPT